MENLSFMSKSAEWRQWGGGGWDTNVENHTLQLKSSEKRDMQKKVIVAAKLG